MTVRTGRALPGAVRSWPGRLRVGRRDPPVQFPRLDGRLDPQLRDRASVQVPIDGQRVGAPAGPAVHGHQRAGETFVQGAFGDQPDQFRDQAGELPGGEAGVDVLGGGVDAGLVERRGGRPDQATAEAAERRSAPEPEGVSQQPGGGGVVAVDPGRAGRREPVLELVPVVPLGVGLQLVGRAVGGDRRGGSGAARRQPAAQVGHQALQLHPVRGWRRFRPQLVDEDVEGDGSVGAGEEDSENERALRPTQVHRLPVPLDAHRAENAEVQPRHGQRPSSLRIPTPQYCHAR